MYIDTIATLIGQNPVPLNTEFIVGGHSTAGDGGGGTFIWISGSPINNEDFGITFNAPNYLNGYFKRLYSGPINARWFGAKGDGATDDTVAVHAARDSEFTKNGGTLYFPKGVYVGAFVFYVVTEQVNIYGDGRGSVLKANGTTDPITGLFNPVLRLGRRTEQWQYSKVYNLTIEGIENSVDPVTGMPIRNYDGVVFDDPTVGGQGFTYPHLSGRWILEQVRFEHCNRGIFKPNGNIGNSYIHCSFSNNNFGYFAKSYNNPQPPPYGVHAGCDRFIGGDIEESMYAAIYIHSIEQYGQFIIEDVIIGAANGFGVYIVLEGGAQITQGSIEIHNCWMEGNGANSPASQQFPITMPPIGTATQGITYTPAEIVDYQFIGARSVSFYDCYVYNMRLQSSSVNLYNCRSDNKPLSFAYWSGVYDVDRLSSINAYELRYASTVNDQIFVNSISYDGSADVFGDVESPTSVWGPLRNLIVKGIGNVIFGFSWDYTAPISFTFLSSTPEKAGVLANVCPKLTIPANGQAYFDFGAPLTVGKYYVWSVHTFLLSGNPTGLIQNAAFVLGQIIMKPGQWACSYGIKKCTVAGNTPVGLNVYNFTTAGAVLRLADVQVVEFDQLSDAVSYTNSRAFSYSSRPILETPPIGISYSGLFRWNTTSRTFEIENGYNIAGIERLEIGVYYISFVLDLDNIPAPQLTPAVSETEGVNVSATYEEPTVRGLTVRLVNVSNGEGVPIDGSFSLSGN